MLSYVCNTGSCQVSTQLRGRYSTQLTNSEEGDDCAVRVGPPDSICLAKNFPLLFPSHSAKARNPSGARWHGKNFILQKISYRDARMQLCAVSTRVYIPGVARKLHLLGPSVRKKAWALHGGADVLFGGAANLRAIDRLLGYLALSAIRGLV